MTSKQRVQMALRHETPDRVPICGDYVPEAAEALKKALNMDDYCDMLVALGNDMLVAGTGMAYSYYLEPDEKGEYVCPWGCTWKYFSNSSGSYTEIIKHPLAGDTDGSLLEQYRIPDPQEESQYANLQNMLDKYGDTHFICGSVTCSIFETSWYLSGLVDVIERMALDEDYTHALFKKMMQFPLQAGLKMIDMGVDMVWLGDDVGMQNCMMMSPDTWRKFLKPHLKEIISAYKKRNPNIKVAYHSCGNIMPIIPDLIEIGLDVLNPVQPMAMDPAELKEKFGHQLSFWGSICIQQTLPNGTVEDVRNEVKLRVETLGKGGGLILSPAHNVQADTPVENILAFYAAAKEAVYNK